MLRVVGADTFYSAEYQIQFQGLINYRILIQYRLKTEYDITLEIADYFSILK